MSDSAYKAKEIGGIAFEVRYMHPDKLLDLEVDIMKVVGPSIAALIDAGGDTDDDDEDSAKLSAGVGIALGEFVKNVNKATLRATCTELQAVSKADGAKLAGVYSAVFLGKPKLRAQWLLFALEVNFSDFLDGGSITSILQTALQGESDKPDPS